MTNYQLTFLALEGKIGKEGILGKGKTMNG
jgi:hypothetical protein